MRKLFNCLLSITINRRCVLTFLVAEPVRASWYCSLCRVFHITITSSSNPLLETGNDHEYDSDREPAPPTKTVDRPAARHGKREAPKEAPAAAPAAAAPRGGGRGGRGGRGGNDDGSFTFLFYLLFYDSETDESCSLP
jgi:hypothetical protein